MELNQSLLLLALKLAQMQTMDDDDDDEDDADHERFTSVEQLFNGEELFEKYRSSGKHDEAYALVKKRYNQGSDLHFATLLVKYYSSLMQTNRPDEAVEIREKLITLLEENLETSGEDLEKYGSYLRKQNKRFEAFLFYQIALKFCENSVNPARSVNVLHRCCSGTVEIVQELMKNQPFLKQLLKSYFIPFMRKIYSRINRFRYLNEKQIVFVLAVCLHCIEQSQFAVEDLQAREETLNEGITLLRGTFGHEAQERHIFGGFLNNLGHTYLLKGRTREAATLFTQAITAKSKAEDYNSLGEKLEDVQKSQFALQLARKSL